MNSRVVSFAGSAIAVEWTGDLPARLVAFLFGRTPENQADHARITFCLSPGETVDELHLSTGDPAEERSGPPGEITLYLMERATYHLADLSRGGPLFHAACLSHAGKAILLPGSSGSGKSSLALWLASLGFQYWSDELAYIPDGGLECQGFPRPVHLKPPAQVFFPGLLENNSQPPDGALRTLTVGSTGWLISPQRLGEAPRKETCSLHCLVFPHYHFEAGFQLERLSRASTAVALARVLVNARNLPGNGFPELLRLARAIPAYQMTYGSFAQIDQSFLALTSSPVQV
jgi:hypothetical protein